MSNKKLYNTTIAIDIIEKLQSIDISKILNDLICGCFITSIPVISYYSFITSSKKFKLNRQLSIANIEIDSPPKLISDTELKQHNNLYYQSVLNNFLSKIDQLGINKTLFINNLLNLNIIKMKKPKKKKFVVIKGYYDIVDNEIHITENEYIDSIYHELLHVASTIMYNGKAFTGFAQSQNNLADVGIGLNEGYTTILEKRYFINHENAYIYEEKYAKKLEQIIGKEKMEKYYFNADLYSLFKEAMKYIDDESFLTMIKELDFINENINDTKNLLKKQYCEKSKQRIGKTLVTMYKSKLLKEVEENIITKEEMNEKLFTYSKSLDIIENDEIRENRK